jgi:hypothetical protein
MTLNRTLCMLAAATVLLVAPGLACAEDAISHPAKKPIGPTSLTQNDMVASLAVLNAKGATLDGNTLTLIGVAPNTIVFADRPVHAAGHVLTAHFIREWDEGAESFAKSPPNATISVLSKQGDTVDDAVVELKSPKLDGDNLSFDVSVLEGDLNDADGAAALFIDRFAAHVRGPHGGHVNVVGGRPAWRGAWYARPGVAFGAGVAAGAVGAAVARPYPYYGAPPCGYYPYPPCPAY